MSNQQHTPEPWGIRCHTCATPSEIGAGDDYTIEGADGTPIGFEPQRRNQRVGADARRIVACVNACAGFSTNELEDVAKHGGFIDQTRYNAKTTKQRDELLAAFNKFMDSHEECIDFDGFTAQIVSMDDYHEAQEYISRMEGTSK